MTWAKDKGAVLVVGCCELCGGGGVTGGSSELFDGELIKLEFLCAINELEVRINELCELGRRKGYVVGFGSVTPLMFING